MGSLLDRLKKGATPRAVDLEGVGDTTEVSPLIALGQLMMEIDQLPGEAEHAAESEGRERRAALIQRASSRELRRS